MVDDIMDAHASRNVIIVGMPRSGTSLVAGVFARHDYFVAEDPGADLREGDHNNPFGYWEAGALTQANAEAFSSAGYDEDNSWLGARAPEDLAPRVQALEPRDTHRALVARYQAHAPWMWKDPRLCYTLGYWWPMVDPERTRVVVTKRDPEAIWQSFVRLHWREATTEAKADVFTRIDHHLSALSATIEALEIPHVEVQYEEFAEDPSRIALRLSELVGRDLAPEDLGFSEKLDRSSLRGRAATFIDHSYERLPPPLRRIAKRLAPRSLVGILFPERTQER